MRRVRIQRGEAGEATRRLYEQTLPQANKIKKKEHLILQIRQWISMIMIIINIGTKNYHYYYYHTVKIIIIIIIIHMIKI